MNSTSAFGVTEASEVAAPRRAALRLASKLGFSEERAGRAALVTTELATNLAKHARHGEILIGPVYSGGEEPTALEILALDRGPGISDVALSRRDGYSTTGSLGHGLGAIERLAESFEFYTHSSGTVIAARISREKGPRSAEDTGFDVAGVEVCKPGESLCGDSWSWRMRRGRLAIMVVDGLGHGAPAHEAASAAKDVFARHHESTPKNLVEDAHAALKATRGAAVAFVALEMDRGIAAFAGLGNITGTILLPSGRRHNMVSHNGTAGHSAARIQEFMYPLPTGSILVMCSDGVQTHWDLAGYPGLLTRGPTIIASVLYRDFSRRRDDVVVVVARERPALADNSH